MPRTPGETDEDLAIPMVVESRATSDDASGPSAAERAAGVVGGPRPAARGGSAPLSAILREASHFSPAEEIALLSAEIAARSDAGRWALHAARALLVDPHGREPAALEDWRVAFRLAPRAWMPFWGLRRGLAHAGSWEEWLGVLDVALGARAGAAAAPSELRAVQWLEQGRLLEERLGRPDEAAASYRAGLREASEHGGLLLALFWLGCAPPDGALGPEARAAARAEAMEGMLRRRLSWARRAALTVAAVRSRRGEGDLREPTAPEPRGDGRSAEHRAEGRPARAGASFTARSPDSGGVRERPGGGRDLLMRTLAVAGSPDVRPLLEELAREACATPDPLARAIALTDLAARLPAADGALAGAILRHAGWLYRRHGRRQAEDPSGRGPDDAALAEATLRLARRRDPRSSLIAGDLAASLLALPPSLPGRAAARGERGGRAEALVELVSGSARAEVRPPGPGPEAEAETELALAWLAACLAEARGRSTAEAGIEVDADLGVADAASAAAGLGPALGYLDGHRQLGRGRVDQLALEVAVRAGAGDRAGLARSFARVAELLAATPARPAVDRAPLAPPPRSLSASGGPARPDAEGGSTPGATVAAPGIPQARDTGGFTPMVAVAHARTREAAAEAHAWVVCGSLWQGVDTPEAQGEAERCWRRALAASPSWKADAWDRLEAVLRRELRWSELAELLANRLDAMGEAATAEATGARARWLEELVRIHRDRLGDPESAVRHHDHLAAHPTDRVRHLVRRWDLELALALKGRPSPSATRLELLSALAGRAPSPALAGALWCDAGELELRDGPAASGRAARAFEAALPHEVHGRAGSGLEQLAAGAAARADAVEVELTRGFVAGSTGAVGAARRRALAFRWAFHLAGAGHPERALAALRRAVAVEPGEGPTGSDLAEVARALAWQIARGARRAAEPEPGYDAGLVLPFDRAEALERGGQTEAAEVAFRELARRPASDTASDALSDVLLDLGSVDVALGWLRVAAAARNPEATREATRALGARLGEPERGALDREDRLLAAVDARGAGRNWKDGGPGAGGSRAGPTPGRTPTDAPTDALVGWAEGIRSGDPGLAAAGLLEVAVASDAPGAPRDGLLLRAALRARLGSQAAASTIHARALELSPALASSPALAAPGPGPADLPVLRVDDGFDGDEGARATRVAEAFACSLADLPVAGRPERIAARHGRADRDGGALAYALELECACDAEARGDARGALDGFARALRRDPAGIEALDGLRRVAVARGDMRGAAAVGLRLGAVISTPARAAAELERAARLLEALGRTRDATAAYWQAFARDPGSATVYARLEALLLDTQNAAPGTATASTGTGTTPAATARAPTAGGGNAAAADGGGVVADGWADDDNVAALDRLYSARLTVERSPDKRVAVLLARADHRARHSGGAVRAAIQDLERVLAVEPAQPEALARLMALARGAGALIHAIAYARRLLERTHDPARRVELHLELAELQVAAGQREGARATLRRSTAESPDAAATWDRLAALALEDGDRKEAISALRGLVAGLGDRADRARLASTWMRIGEVVRADAGAEPRSDAHGSARASDDPHAAALRAAAAAFRTAVEHGAGSAGHVALAAVLAEAGAWSERAAWLDAEAGEAARRVGEDPGDAARVQELHLLFELARQRPPEGASPPRLAAVGPAGGAERAEEPHQPRAELGARLTAQLLDLLQAPRPRPQQVAGEAPWARQADRAGERGAPDPERQREDDRAAAAPLASVRFLGELFPPLAAPSRSAGWQRSPRRSGANTDANTDADIDANFDANFDGDPAVDAAASIWALLAPHAEALVGPRASPPELGPRGAVSTALHPELGWIERTAVELGIPTLRLSIARRDGGDRLAALDGPRPELVLPADFLEHARDPAARFRVARTLALLREHAGWFDAVEDSDVAALFQAAATLATGRQTLSPESSADGTEAARARIVKILGRALPRKARRALVEIFAGLRSEGASPEVDGGGGAAASGGQAPADSSAYGEFRRRVLEVADRVGLGVAGDLRAALLALPAPVAGGAASPPPVVVAPLEASAPSSRLGSPRARALVRFALTDTFLLAPREVPDHAAAPPISFGPPLETS